MPPCGAQARCAFGRSWPCFRPPSASRRAIAPVGRRLSIITNGGGPGVLAADWISEINLKLGQLSDGAVEALKPALPAQASLCDLIDLSEEATPEHYRLALDAASKEKGDRRNPRHPLAEDRLRCRGGGRCAGGFQGPHQQALAHLLDGRCLGRRSAHGAQHRHDPDLPHP
jgi:hypothetical protein